MILDKKLFTLVPLLFLFSCYNPINETLIDGQTMGTTYSVKIIDHIDNKNEIKKNIDLLLDNLNNQFSKYIKNSEISRINHSELLEIEASKTFLNVLNKALYYSDLSNGLYDVTVSPLVDLWGFSNYDLSDFPTEQEINKIKKNIGYKNLHIENNFVIKNNENVSIDLNSIAKGYAIDIIYDYLLNEGFVNYLIEIGGEVRTKSDKTKDWIIGIQHPQKNTFLKKIKINNFSMATSGTYNNFFTKDGIEYSHIINPITGYPIKHKIIGATVISNKCIDADALATMLMVVDEKKGINIIDNIDDVECLLILKDESNSISLEYSAEFKKFIVD